jgi:hypothetical protein
MEAKELPIYEAAYRHTIKRVHEDLVQVLVILILALLVEIEIGCHLTALVVSPNQID